MPGALEPTVSPLAGKPAPRDILVDVSRLIHEYYARVPDPANAAERVSFGTSGHRGSALHGAFNETHILAITQAICEYRNARGVDGPLFIGKDTHAVSEPAQRSALEVLAANGVTVMVASGDGITPTPVVSHAILTYNRGRANGLADGIVVTPSHNPPEDGGFKYDPPHGGPASSEATAWIQDRANSLIREKNAGVKRLPFERATVATTTRPYDFMTPYVRDLGNVVDMKAIANAKLRLGVDPLGGASIHYWAPINEYYGTDIRVVNDAIDPTFSFMTVDYDGRIRMDCSSPYAMRRLVALKDDFDVAFANDTDADRHGIVTRSAGLLNPNHYLAVAIEYLLGHRQAWPQNAAVGKTVVSSSMIDRVVASLNRRLSEVPVGFKWFVEGLIGGSYCFGGEESAGASFLRRDGSVWTTDKDGIIMALLAAEITARTGRDPGEHYADLERRFGTAYYTRVDAPATAQEKAAFATLTAESVTEGTLAGEPILAKLTHAPGNDAPIGGLKVTAQNGWFAARPSGTEAVYKIYAESFVDKTHLDRVLDEAERIVRAVIA